MTVLQEKLTEMRGDFEALFEGDFYFAEVAALVESLAKVADEVYPTGNPEENLANLREAWDWVNEEFDIVQKVDDALVLPAMLEMVDGPAIKALIEQLVLPTAAKLMTKDSA